VPKLVYLGVSNLVYVEVLILVYGSIANSITVKLYRLTSRNNVSSSK
jgi:hypothetical protein